MEAYSEHLGWVCLRFQIRFRNPRAPLLRLHLHLNTKEISHEQCGKSPQDQLHRIHHHGH